MKYIASFLIIILALYSEGQSPVLSKDIEIIEPFHSVQVNARYNVHIKQSNEIKLEANALKEVLDVTTFEVEQGVLYINVKRDDSDKSIWEQIDDIKIAPKLDLFISMKDIQELHVNGNGKITTENSIASDSLTLSVSGNGTLDADVKGGVVAINLSGGGLMKLSGYAKQANVNLSGYGKIESYPLELTSAKATLSGSGDAEITVSDNLIATINGSGSLFHKGETHEVTKKENGSGEIVRKY